MTIHYRDVARLPPALEAGATFHDNDASFLAACDVLSLNAPGAEGTYHWLNSDRIAMLPRGVVVVNAARGMLVDDAALIAALQSGHVGFAGLDVFEGEPKLNPDYFGWRMWCCCRISVARRSRRAMRWGVSHSTASPPCWRGTQTRQPCDTAIAGLAVFT